MRHHRPLAWLALSVLTLGAGTARAVPCPNVMLVLDQSGSMDESPDGQFGKKPTKWDLMVTAVESILTAYGDQLPFGLELFTSNSFGDQACYNDTMINVEPAHDTAPDIKMIVQMSMPDGGTNTGEAIKRAAASKVMQDKSRGQYIVLITDGDPNCNSNDGTSAAYTISEIAAAAEQDPPIHTFVIGFDGTAGINPASLNKMATAGLEPIMGCKSTTTSPCYYSASNAQKFNDSLSKIVNFIVGGEFGMTMCDDSCFANGCPAGQVCRMNEFNPKPHCEPDPCAGVDTCADMDYCRLGECVRACSKPCPSGTKCIDGTCVRDPCANQICTGTDVCDPLSGQCIVNPCLDKTCKAPTQCEVATGNCVDDACQYISHMKNGTVIPGCPDGSVCKPGGNCEATMGGTDPGGKSGRSGVGCSVSGAARGDATGLLSGMGLLLGLGALLGRAARRRWS